MSELDKRLPWVWIVAAVALVVAIFDVWWFAKYRHGFPLTIDEAGYIAIGLNDHIGFQSGGLHGWWKAIEDEVPQAPLVPAIASATLILKNGVLNAFGVLTAFSVVLTLAAYGIGKRLAGAALGALAAVVVATLPGTFVFAREYVFALPAAALLSCAVFALLCSDGLRNRRWSIACGVAIGLMLLTRTMTVAFVPPLLVAAVVAAIGRGRVLGQGQMGRRAVNLALLIFCTLVLAATWYLRNYEPVYEYLTNYGYGSNAANYGANHSLLSWGRWNAVATRMIYTDLLLPLAVLIVIGLIVLACVAVRRVQTAESRRDTVIRLAASDVFTVALVVACCYVALTSSRNGGEGFTIPVSALLPPLAVVSLRYLTRRVVAPVLAALGVIVVFNLLSNSNLSESLSKTRLVDVPTLGNLPWANGVPHAVSAVRAEVPGPEAKFGPDDARYQEINEELVAFVVHQIEAGAHEPVAFASRNQVINTSSFAFGGLVQFSRPFFMIQINAEPEDSVANYVRLLSRPEFGRPGFLITMSDETGDYPPLVTQRYAEAAARRTGFRIVKTWTLPDGRQMRVWERRES
jgi:hypothetical protein